MSGYQASRAPDSVQYPLVRAKADIAGAVRVAMRRCVASVVFRIRDLDQVDMIVDLGPRDFHRAAGLANDALRDRADHEALDAGQTLAADNDQVAPISRASARISPAA